jgi:hypothetical protein
MIATSNVVLIYGNTQINWKSLAVVIAVLMWYGLGRLLHGTDGHQLYAPVGAHALDITRSIQYLIEDSKRPTLELVLFTCYPFEVTDARNTIFALLNISSDAGDAILAPDYNKPVGTVFIDSTAHLLMKKSSAILILYAAGIGSRRSLDKLPSWVPEWTIPYYWNRLWKHGDYCRSARR